MWTPAVWPASVTAPAVARSGMDEPQLGKDHLHDLPLPDVVNWAIFPFEGDLRVRTVNPYADTPRPRSGEPEGGPCHCESPDDNRTMVWSNDRWQVREIHFNWTEGTPAPFPSYMLETVEHLDIEDLDEAYAAELGIMTLRMERAIKAIGSIERVHFNRWGDGGSHFHVWFLGRPFGARQFNGFTLPFWGFILPPMDEATVEANHAIVRASLEAAETPAVTPDA